MPARPLCEAGQQSDSAENLPGSKIQFTNVIYHKVAWTSVRAQREKNKQMRVRTRSPGYGLIKLELLSPRPCSKQADTAPVQETDSISVWESEIVLVTKLPHLQNSSPKDGACSQGEIIFSNVSFLEQSWHHYVACANWLWSSFCWTFSILKNNAIATQSTEVS